MGLSRLNVPGTLVIVAVALVGEAAVRSGVVAYEYFPAPSGILVALRDLLLSGEMLTQTLHTLRSVLIGWVVANIIGINVPLLETLELHDVNASGNAGHGIWAQTLRASDVQANDNGGRGVITL